MFNKEFLLQILITYAVCIGIPLILFISIIPIINNIFFGLLILGFFIFLFFDYKKIKKN